MEASRTPSSPVWGRWCGAGSPIGDPSPTPSTVTVNVCSEMLATPTTAGPVLNSIGLLPTDSFTVLCAGQNRSGTHCTTLLSSHSNLPVMAGIDLTSMARSAAGPSAMGPLKVTTTGCATPTTSPRVGKIDLMAELSGRLTAVVSTPAVPPATVMATTITARTN